MSRGGSSDFTALGDAPNTAAQFAAQAKVGEILVTEAAREKASIGAKALERRHLSLKGHPVDAVVALAG